MLRKILISLAPFGVLLIAISLAAVLGFAVLLIIGDVLQMDKIVSKGTQIFLVLSIIPLRRWLQLEWKEIGITDKSLLIRQLGAGLVVGMATLGPVILVLFCLDIRLLDSARTWAIGELLGTAGVSLLAAFAISLLEEPVFRGVLLIGLQRKLAVPAAVVISACYYAGLHFMKTDIEIPYTELNIFSGFQLAYDAFGNVFKFDHLSAFLALLMVGIFLALARLKVGLGLGFCIGCHTAWVFLIKVSKAMSYLNTESDYFFLVSHYDGVIGPMVTGWLLLVILGYLAYEKYFLFGK